MYKNVAIVIRSIGERTEQLCTELIQRFIPGAKIFTVHEKPFAKALVKSFEIGANSGCDFLFCIDADLFIFKDSVAVMLDNLKDQDKNIFGLTPMVFDKFTGQRKRGGPHLYKVGILEKALRYGEESYFQLRPETFIKHRLSDDGYLIGTMDNVVCLHDFEQYYEDIFKKYVVKTKKNDNLLKLWRERADLLKNVDLDYQMVKAALEAGVELVFDNRSPDSDLWRSEASEAMKSLGLKEKDDTLDLPKWINKMGYFSSHDKILYGSKLLRVFKEVNKKMFNAFPLKIIAKGSASNLFDNYF